MKYRMINEKKMRFEREGDKGKADRKEVHRKIERQRVDDINREREREREEI